MLSQSSEIIYSGVEDEIVNFSFSFKICQASTFFQIYHNGLNLWYEYFICTSLLGVIPADVQVRTLSNEYVRRIIWQGSKYTSDILTVNDKDTRITCRKMHIFLLAGNSFLFVHLYGYNFVKAFHILLYIHERFFMKYFCRIWKEYWDS